MNIPQTGFFFDEENHRYYLDGRQMTGVTTILSILAKPALIQWAANMAVDYIEGLARTRSDGERYVLLDIPEFQKARKAHAQKRDESADIGKLAHKWCERYVKGENPEREEALGIITDNFLKWVEEAKPKFIASEKVVWSQKHWFAGTLDFIAEIDGKVYLGDIKTGSGIYSEMFLQTSGYQLALEETEPKIKIEGHIIVNPTKKGELNVKTHYDYEATKKGFLACLELYRLLNNG
jgi:CRISPR/Cas system-associated exonuclease Cas4 (RecB family)